MPELRPFRAVRYAADAGALGRLLAPPYDVVDAEEARELRSRSPRNSVRLVLPTGEAPDRYRRAARRLRGWLDEGVLVREDRPAHWLYRQSFTHAGRRRARHAFLTSLRLSPPERGEVVPHEETHRGPKEDRLALMQAAGAQLSPVFLLAPDPGGRVSGLVDRARAGEPALRGETPDGQEHALWPVPEGPLAEEVSGTLGRRPLLIADGHHRYETALELQRRQPDNPRARWTLACITGERDPGLLALPTHRSLRRPPPGAAGWTEPLAERFELEELGAGPGEAARAAADAGSGGLAAVIGGDRAWLLRPRAAALQQAGLSEAAAGAAPYLFDRLVLRANYGRGPEEAVEEGLLEYRRDPEAAARAAGPEGAAFLLGPLGPDAVWKLATEEGRLPPKSTYFWPKVPTGLLFRLL